MADGGGASAPWSGEWSGGWIGWQGASSIWRDDKGQKVLRDVVAYYGSAVDVVKFKEEEGELALEVKQEPESPVMEVKVEPVELQVPFEPMVLALVKLQVDWNSPSEEEPLLPPS